MATIDMSLHLGMDMAKKRLAPAAWSDPDDAPELTDAFFERANIYDVGKRVRRGRPPMETPKLQVTVRLDRDVLEALRADGSGWQTRLNAILRKAIGLA